MSVWYYCGMKGSPYSPQIHFIINPPKLYPLLSPFQFHLSIFYLHQALPIYSALAIQRCTSTRPISSCSPLPYMVITSCEQHLLANQRPLLFICICEQLFGHYISQNLLAASRCDIVVETYTSTTFGWPVHCEYCCSRVLALLSKVSVSECRLAIVNTSDIHSQLRVDIYHRQRFT